MKFVLSPSQILAIFLAVISLIIWGLSINKTLDIVLINYIQSILLLIAIIALSSKTKEGFFFQVSPEREKCLIEQVAPIHNRSEGCCNKGYIGGNLPIYNEWITPNTFSGPWKRTDNLTLNPKDNRLSIQVPPIELVEEGKWIQENKKKTQKQLYTQQE